MYHFIFDICNSYHSENPYHNFRHAVDVLQANYYFLCKIGAIQPMSGEIIVQSSESPIDSQIRELLQPLDIFALLMASIGHDVGHPGVNNNFMVITIVLYKQRVTFYLFVYLCVNRLQHLLLSPFSTMIGRYWRVFTQCHFSIYYKDTVLVS